MSFVEDGSVTASWDRCCDGSGSACPSQTRSLTGPRCPPASRVASAPIPKIGDTSGLRVDPLRMGHVSEGDPPAEPRAPETRLMAAPRHLTGTRRSSARGAGGRCASTAGLVCTGRIDCCSTRRSSRRRQPLNGLGSRPVRRVRSSGSLADQAAPCSPLPARPGAARERSRATPVPQARPGWRIRPLRTINLSLSLSLAALSNRGICPGGRLG